MTLRTLPLVPVVAVAALVAAWAAFPPGEAARLLQVTDVLSSAAAATACLAAGAAFSSGDLLWRAWLLQSLSWVTLALAVILGGPAGAAGGTMAPLHAAALVASNATAIASLVSFAAVLWKADLGFAASTAERVGVWAFAVAVALAFAGVVLMSDLAQALTTGSLRDVVFVLADATDLFIFLLTAPILLVALGVRGGALAWIWGLIAAGNLGWILVDAASGPLAEVLPPAHAQLLAHAGTACAAWCWAAAALAQRRVARGG
jgi:hypothetical protein